MTHLDLANDSWNLNILKLYFEILNLKYHNFVIMSVFHMWMVGYKFFYQNLFNKKVFSLSKLIFWCESLKVF